MTQPPDGHQPDAPRPQGPAPMQAGPQHPGQQPERQPGFQQSGYQQPGQVATGAAPARSGKRWLVPALAAGVALVLGLGAGTGVGIASTSGERSGLKEQKRALEAKSAGLQEKLETTQAELASATGILDLCRDSGTALKALTDVSTEFLDAASEFDQAAVGSRAEAEAERKLNALYDKFQQQLGVAKSKAVGCSVPPGTKS